MMEDGFRIDSCIRFDPEKSSQRVMEGTICRISIRSLLEPTKIVTDIENIILNEFKPFRVCIGSSPDLAPPYTNIKPAIFLSLFHILEYELFGCFSKTQKIIDVTNLKNQEKVKIEFIVDNFISQPKFHPTFEDISSDKLDELGERLDGPPKQISAWNHTYSAILYSRAMALKERGNYLFNKFKNESQRHLLKSSYACYLRALQLIQCLNLSCCFPKDELNDNSDFEFVTKKYETEFQFLETLVNEDFSPFRLYDIVSTFDGLTLLEFKVLLNIAACHMKVKSCSQAVEFCTKALELRPVDDNTSAEKSEVAPKLDIAKAYLRRGEALYYLQEFDDARSDLESSAKTDSKYKELVDDILSKVDEKIYDIKKNMKMRLKKQFNG